MVVRDDPANVRRDGGPQLAQVTLGDDRVGDVEQRSPVVALRVKPSFPCHVGSIVTRTSDVCKTRCLHVVTALPWPVMDCATQID